MGRGRERPARRAGGPREEAARRLDDLLGPGDAGRGPARPEQGRRGRTAVAGRLRGAEATRSADTRAVPQAPPGRGHRATGPPLSSRRQAGQGGTLEGGTRGARTGGPEVSPPR